MRAAAHRRDGIATDGEKPSYSPGSDYAVPGREGAVYKLRRRRALDTTLLKNVEQEDKVSAREGKVR